MWAKKYFSPEFGLQLAEIFFQNLLSKAAGELMDFSCSILSFADIQVRKNRSYGGSMCGNSGTANATSSTYSMFKLM